MAAPTSHPVGKHWNAAPCDRDGVSNVRPDEAPGGL